MIRMALVTGGTGHIGIELVRALGADGYNVAFTYQSRGDDAVALEHELEKKGRRALAMELDMAKDVDFEDFIYTVERRLGKVSLLVLSASRFEEYSGEGEHPVNVREQFRANVEGQFLLVQAVAKRMKAHGRGRIIFLLDTAGERIFPRYLPYSISKAANYAMVKGFAKMCAPYVVVNGVSPGIVREPDHLSDEEKEALIRKVPAGVFGKTDDVVRTVLFLADAPSYITGEVIGVDGGYGL